jgi:hypothetical protein
MALTEEEILLSDEEPSVFEENSSGVESDYEGHVVRQNALYALSFEEFEAGLTPEERAKLIASGAMSHASPDIEDYKAYAKKKELLGVTKDAAESSLASYSTDLAGAVDKVADELLELGVPREVAVKVAVWHEARLSREAEARKAALIVKFAGVFLGCSNVRLMAAALAYSADLALTYGMGTMTEWGRQHGLSRSAVSKVSNWWKRELGLPGGSHMEEEKTCQALSEAQKKKHWRKQKYGNKSVGK